MTKREPTQGWLSRRAFVGAVAVGTAGLAGCTSNGSEQNTSPSGDSPVLGDPDAAVTLEVFEDFNCPHCQRYNAEQFPTIKSGYLDPGKIRYVHRDLPFIHETSWAAASAAREVYLTEGKPFWSYKSGLMSEGARIQQDAPGIFGEIAEQEGLDADAIQQAGAERANENLVTSDRSRAENLGITATPSFVVDGELMDGLGDARDTIDSKLSE